MHHSFITTAPTHEPIADQKRAKTGVSREKPPDPPLQTLTSHMLPECDLKHSGEREFALLPTSPWRHAGWGEEAVVTND